MTAKFQINTVTLKQNENSIIFSSKKSQISEEEIENEDDLCY